MKLKAIRLLLVPATLMLLVACGGNAAEPEMNIEAAVEASVNEVPETTPSPLPTATEAPPTPTATPVFRGKSHQSCITLANKIKTLNISPGNIHSPKNTELPENSRIIELYEIIEYSNNKTTPLEIDGKSLMCKAKAKTPQGNYPIEFYLMIENRVEYIVLESQGKRKWIFKWPVKEH